MVGIEASFDEIATVGRGSQEFSINSIGLRNQRLRVKGARTSKSGESKARAESRHKHAAFTSLYSHTEPPMPIALSAINAAVIFARQSTAKHSGKPSTRAHHSRQAHVRCVFDQNLQLHRWSSFSLLFIAKRNN